MLKNSYVESVLLECGLCDREFKSHLLDMLNRNVSQDEIVNDVMDYIFAIKKVISRVIQDIECDAIMKGM